MKLWIQHADGVPEAALKVTVDDDADVSDVVQACVPLFAFGPAGVSLKASQMQLVYEDSPLSNRDPVATVCSNGATLLIRPRPGTVSIPALSLSPRQASSSSTRSPSSNRSPVPRLRSSSPARNDDRGGGAPRFMSKTSSSEQPRESSLAWNSSLQFAPPRDKAPPPEPPHSARSKSTDQAPPAVASRMTQSLLAKHEPREKKRTPSPESRPRWASSLKASIPARLPEEKTRARQPSQEGAHKAATPPPNGKGKAKPSPSKEEGDALPSPRKEGGARGSTTHPIPRKEGGAKATASPPSKEEVPKPVHPSPAKEGGAKPAPKAPAKHHGSKHADPHERTVPVLPKEDKQPERKEDKPERKEEKAESPAEEPAIREEPCEQPVPVTEGGQAPPAEPPSDMTASSSSATEPNTDLNTTQESKGSTDDEHTSAHEDSKKTVEGLEASEGSRSRAVEEADNELQCAQDDTEIRETVQRSPSGSPDPELVYEPDWDALIDCLPTLSDDDDGRRAAEIFVHCSASAPNPTPDLGLGLDEVTIGMSDILPVRVGFDLRSVFNIAFKALLSKGLDGFDEEDEFRVTEVQFPLFIEAVRHYFELCKAVFPSELPDPRVELPREDLESKTAGLLHSWGNLSTLPGDRDTLVFGSFAIWAIGEAWRADDTGAMGDMGDAEDAGQPLNQSCSTASSVPAAQTESRDWSALFDEFYRLYNPDKIGTVEALLEKYAGDEQDLWNMMLEKYNVTEETWRKGKVDAADECEAEY
eukprot:Sspe_Gene.53501::Locus_29561_Transcript_3_3_Confidence_0.500_Length_2530::g.53501::m.53501